MLVLPKLLSKDHEDGLRGGIIDVGEHRSLSPLRCYLLNAFPFNRYEIKERGPGRIADLVILAPYGLQLHVNNQIITRLPLFKGLIFINYNYSCGQVFTSTQVLLANQLQGEFRGK